MFYPEMWSENPPQHGGIHGYHDGFTVKPGQAYPQDSINEFINQKLNPFSSCGFQIYLFILACVMGREFTREAVKKFLPAHFL